MQASKKEANFDKIIAGELWRGVFNSEARRKKRKKNISSLNGWGGILDCDRGLTSKSVGGLESTLSKNKKILKQTHTDTHII